MTLATIATIAKSASRSGAPSGASGFAGVMNSVNAVNLACVAPQVLSHPFHPTHPSHSITARSKSKATTPRGSGCCSAANAASAAMSPMLFPRMSPMLCPRMSPNRPPTMPRCDSTSVSLSATVASSPLRIRNASSLSSISSVSSRPWSSVGRSWGSPVRGSYWGAVAPLSGSKTASTTKGSHLMYFLHFSCFSAMPNSMHSPTSRSIGSLGGSIGSKAGWECVIHGNFGSFGKCYNFGNGVNGGGRGSFGNFGNFGNFYSGGHSPHLPMVHPNHLTTQQIQQIQIRNFANKRRPTSKKDDSLPLLNEHLIAKLLTRHLEKKRRGPNTNNSNDVNDSNDSNDDSGEQSDIPNQSNVSADTFQVRLVVEPGHVGANDANDDSDDEEGDGKSSKSNQSSQSLDPSAPTNQVVTLTQAIQISSDLSLDLMEVSLQQTPPVIKALDFDSWLYDHKKRERKASKAAKKGTKGKKGTGDISSKFGAIKEFKFRAGIADHDLKRKAEGLIKYLDKGHAVQVTLTVKSRILAVEKDAIVKTLERVKELVGERGVQAREMQVNEAGTVATMVMHPAE